MRHSNLMHNDGWQTSLTLWGLAQAYAFGNLFASRRCCKCAYDYINTGEHAVKEIFIPTKITHPAKTWII